ncbi:MAG: hypothetical protein ACI8WY_003818, partial [Planctomycetota bacterium]
ERRHSPAQRHVEQTRYLNDTAVIPAIPPDGDCCRRGLAELTPVRYQMTEPPGT